MSAGSVLFGFLAGVLSILSPCVLPLLPLVLGGAASAHRFGMPALVAGLVLTFVIVGLFVATIGFSIGIDGDAVRAVAAVFLGGFGLVLLSGRLRRWFAVGLSGLGQSGDQLAGAIDRRPAGGTARTLAGQFAIGGALGAVWSPCVGPTLGAASLLAAQARDLGSVATVMLAFGIGAATPLLLLGWLSREAMARWRGRMMRAGAAGRQALGAGALAVALLILSGADRRLETLAVDHSPAWLTDLTTRY